MESTSYTEQLGETYDIVFIGAGPSTLAFFCYVIKKEALYKLLTNFKILIVEKTSSFGSGCLGKYGINSNTSGEGFIRLLCKSPEKYENTALSPQKQKTKVEKINTGSNNTNNASNNNNNNNNNNIKTVKKDSGAEKIIPMYSDLYHSQTSKALISYGNKPAPLPLIGYFLDCIGNTILDNVYKMQGKKIIMFNTEVTKVYFNKNYNYELSLLKDDTHTLIKAKAIVFATGGKQILDQKQISEINTTLDPNDFYHSDFVLQEKGYQSIIERLSAKKRKKVIIVGGSHSAFSCAWILLNEPADYYKFDSTTFYKAKTCYSCRKCSKQFCCFGEVKNRNWRFTKMPLDDIEIEILYKDHVKVYYHSEKDAQNDGYNVYDPKKACNKNGNIYPFIGIRGDAKELYRRIVHGSEKRVKLIKCPSWEKQLIHIKNADAVIWACGYTTNKIPVYERSTNKVIEFHSDNNNLIEISKDNLNLLDLVQHEYPSLYGIGQGFSTHSIEILANGKSARADSVSLYNTYIAKKLFKSFEANMNKIKQTISDEKPVQKKPQNKETLNTLNSTNNNRNTTKQLTTENSKDIQTITSAKEPGTSGIFTRRQQSINELKNTQSSLVLPKTPNLKDQISLRSMREILTNNKNTATNTITNKFNTEQENYYKNLATNIMPSNTPKKPLITNMRYYDNINQPSYDVRDKNLAILVNKSIERINKRRSIIAGKFERYNKRIPSVTKSVNYIPPIECNTKPISKVIEVPKNKDYYMLGTKVVNSIDITSNKLNIFSFKNK
jgi:IS1 family transposase